MRNKIMEIKQHKNILLSQIYILNFDSIINKKRLVQQTMRNSLFFIFLFLLIHQALNAIIQTPHQKAKTQFQRQEQNIGQASVFWSQSPTSSKNSQEGQKLGLLSKSSQNNFYSREQKHAEKTYLKFGIPGRQRAKISQSQIITQGNEANIVSKSTQNSLKMSKIMEKQSPISTKPKSQQKYIVNRQFQEGGIGLYHDVPSKLVKGQFYLFKGVITNPQLLYPPGSSTFRFNYVNIIFTQWKTRDQFKCIHEVKEKKYQFSISCQIKKTGNFMLTVFAGQYGMSSDRIITIIDIQSLFKGKDIKSYEYSSTIPQGLKVSVVNNDLIIRWDSSSALTYLTISQQNNTTLIQKQFLLSNYHEFMSVPFHMFENFTKSNTTIQIRHADSKDGTLAEFTSKFSQQPIKLNFKAIQHAFDEVAEDIKISPQIPWSVEAGSRLKLNATFQQDVKKQVYIVEPNRNIRIVKLQLAKSSPNQPPNSYFKAGTPLKLELNFNQPGTNIIEINAISGSAIVNRPVYVGDNLPLLPDHQDMLSHSYQAGQNQLSALQKFVAKTTTGKFISEPSLTHSTLQQKREYLLYLLNSLRQKYSQLPVVMDDLLNQIAQAHSDDMKIKNYFSHTSMNGNGPGARAKKFNFTSSVGENIAKAFSLTEAHLGLERSAAHLQNSVDPSWTRVGIGISISDRNQCIVAFTFSTRDLAKQPLTDEQLLQFQKQLASLIQQKNKGTVKQSKQLSSDVTQWLNKPQKEEVFQYLVSRGGYRGPMIASSFSIPYSKDWVKKLKNSDLLQARQRFKQFGIGIREDKDQRGLQSYVVFR